jgi:peroxiredoxin
MTWQIPVRQRFKRRPLFFLILLSLAVLGGCGENAPPALEIGDTAPAFTVLSLEDREISLVDYQGSPVVIRFILTDCPYCRADTGVLNDYYLRYFAKGLRVLYIDSLGIDRGTLATFAREMDINFPVAQDLDGKVAASYHVKALPQAIILGPDHKIIAAIRGGVSEPELDRLLSPYFQ